MYVNVNIHEHFSEVTVSIRLAVSIRSSLLILCCVEVAVVLGSVAA